ncbi:hypothetical protein E1B28_009526 [Marasmius oreades]|uniref:F-box domain-containing protein n=1 Tax=Marasmius oreades TaxID=181124 RepID=A0A9P7URS9_9AGAR|nr:uncharacterized protein E1B28_009526 [Marasmius oreades]KAG7090406.1 hypothetical protein E1B28_009526 [Marasmius oreades]
MDNHPTSRCHHCNFDIAASHRQSPGPSQYLLEKYTKSNKYPHIHEAASIKAAMEEAKNQEILLDETIAQFQSAIASLSAEKARIQKVIRQYRWILRPIHGLPPEILIRIFSFTLDFPVPSKNEGGYETYWPSSSLSPSGMPWVLAQVSRLWRHLALAVPSLWSLVSLSWHPVPGEVTESLKLHSQIHLLCLQIQRSENYPLDVVASTRNPISIIPLYSHSHRWRTLHIELDNESVLTTSLIRGRLPLLESLELRWSGGPINELDCFEFAPRLQTLRLSGEIGTRVGDFPLKLPKLQIKHLSIHDLHNSTHLAFISHHKAVKEFPKLQTCRFSFHLETIHSFLHLRTQWPDTHVFLRNLEELELYHAQEIGGIESMLSWIKAPSLKTLSIFSTGPNRSPFEDFFAQPASLTSLTIHRVEMPASEFSAILALLKGLQHLKFGVLNGITNDYLEPLSATMLDELSIVPDLHKLALLPTPGCAHLPYDDDLLVNVLEARWRGQLTADDWRCSTGPPDGLFSVELDHEITSEKARRRIDVLRAEGMHIKECNVSKGSESVLTR